MKSKDRNGNLKLNQMITIEQIKRIADDIKADDEWVNDSHSAAEHKGVRMGLEMLVRHLEDIKETEQSKWWSKAEKEIKDGYWWVKLADIKFGK